MSAKQREVAADKNQTTAAAANQADIDAVVRAKDARRVHFIVGFRESIAGERHARAYTGATLQKIATIELILGHVTSYQKSTATSQEDRRYIWVVITNA